MTDLVHWTPRGHVFPAPQLPGWAESQFYAPELHWLAGLGRYAVYYAANTGPDKVSPDSTETSYMFPFTPISTLLLGRQTCGGRGFG